MDKKKTTLITVISILSIFALIIFGGLVYYTQISPGENAAYAKEAALKAAAAIMADRQSSMFAKTEPAASPVAEQAEVTVETAAGEENLSSEEIKTAAETAVSSEAAVPAETASAVEAAASAETPASTEAPASAETPSPTPTPFDVKVQLQRSRNDGSFWEGCPARDIELLTPNEYSRPQTALETVNNLVIHYVGNAGSSAMDNRNYFESLKDSRERSASSHFVIGLDGEIVQCIPLSEVAYATKERNRDTISIECCHPGADGQFNEYTYWSLVELSAWLCRQFQLDPQQILRHYDVTGKLCPLYYVENPDAWQELKDAIERRLGEIQGSNSPS
jgi:hypothetical protein